MADLTPEQIAEIATKAAMAAVAAATGGAQAPSAPPEQSGEFSADDLARFKQSGSEEEDRRKRAAELAAELLPLLLAERHMIVFQWMTQGIDAGMAVQQIVRAEVSRRMPDYREAMGQGGSSSRDMQGLADRLPRRD